MDSTPNRKRKKQSFPPGYEFVPSDQHLLKYYLTRRVSGKHLPETPITDCDIYADKAPWEIFTGKSNGEVYYFTRIKRKFDNGKKIDRIVANGTWRIQNSKRVYENQKKRINLLGFKKTLNFIPDDEEIAKRMSWIMHEYTLLDSPRDQDEWTICRIKRGRKKVNTDHDDDDEETVSFDSENSTASKTGVLASDAQGRPRNKVGAAGTSNVLDQEEEEEEEEEEKEEEEERFGVGVGLYLALPMATTTTTIRTNLSPPREELREELPSSSNDSGELEPDSIADILSKSYIKFL